MSTVEPIDAGAGPGLRHYLDVLRRRWKLVASVMAVTLLAAGILTALESPVYRAETSVVIGQGDSLFQVQFGNSIQPFTATMSQLVTSEAVARSVISRLGLQDSPGDLLSKIGVSVNPSTAVLGISVDAPTPGEAERIATAIDAVFPRLVAQRLGRAAPTPKGATPQPPLTATVWDRAHVVGQVSPRPARNLALGLALGLVLGLLGAFLRDHFDRALRTREAVEEAFGVPVIGQVPFAKESQDPAGEPQWEGLAARAEAFRALRANLEYLRVKRRLRTILVTSATPSQGKTTVAANLGLAIASSGSSSVVIEGDLRRPQLAAALGLDPGPRDTGLTSVLLGEVTLDEVAEPVFVGGDDRRLLYVPSGPLPVNPSELLSSAPMAEALERLSARNDFTLVDSPPLLAVADALEVARLVDGVIVVARANHTTVDDAREVRALVARLGLELVGVVLTDVNPAGGYPKYGYGPELGEPLSWQSRRPARLARTVDDPA
ncbi:MAG: polysaccharide biosynthesis tyrosine autokinase [Actinobacteria bacterium]|nr:polysaccharide biosynthesis tyrosine autokinase [Actinomycetota bacterium]